jgi:hypothetical protein
MSYRKTDDLVVKVGEYQKDGETKGRYENVGQILSDGERELYMIKRTFNPAGVPNPDGKDSVLLSRFAVREQEQGKPAARPEAEPYSDKIPF